MKLTDIKKDLKIDCLNGGMFIRQELPLLPIYWLRNTDIIQKSGISRLAP